MSRARGFTLIELVVVVCVVVLAFGVALERMERYLELVERSAVEQNVAAINVGLSLKFAALVAAGKAGSMADDVGTNPVKVLSRPPENYLGELYAPAPGSVGRRSWYFDRSTGEMVYVPNRTRFLAFASPAATALRFRIALTEAETEPGRPKTVPQPYLHTQTPFRWNIE